MASPNIINVSNIVGSTDVLDITDTKSTLTENPSASDKLYKLNTVMISNSDGAADYTVDVELFRNSTSYYLAYQVTVPAQSSLVLISKDTSMYLEEGDAVRCVSIQSGVLQAISSYDIIDDA